MIEEFYKGRRLFLTGCTGFLGKVILEKIMRALPEIDKLYILVRAKAGMSVDERMKKEILSTPLFDILRKQRPDFDAFAESKLHAVSGDLIQENLGLSREDYAMLTANVDVVINCAASVDFNSRLDEAIQINVLGPQRMLDLARKCRDLKAFVHVSTAYVNANKRGWVEEKIYPCQFDPEALIQDVLKMSPKDVLAVTPKLMEGYPNTYTFSKYIGETMLQKYKGHLPVSIVRPAIIGATYKEPFAGWTDVVTAAGAIFMTCGVGLLRVAWGDNEVIGDQIPADYVADLIIVAGAFCRPTNEIRVYHCGSSSRNPIKWGEARVLALQYWRAHPPEKRLGKARTTLYKSQAAYRTAVFIQQTIPSLAFNAVANVSRNGALKKKANRFQKMISRAQFLTQTFEFFMRNEWIFDTRNVCALALDMSPEELQTWRLDVTDIKWRDFHHYFCYGLKRFVLKEAAEDPGPNNLLEQSLVGRLFSDITWAYNCSPSTQYIRPPSEMQSLVLNSAKVREAIQEAVALALKKSPKANKEILLVQQEKKARDMLERISSNLQLPVVRFLGWFMHKVWIQIYEKVVVDEKALMRLKDLVAKSSGPVVIIPTHRSYIDFLIVSYIFFAYDIKLPYIAAGEDFLAITLVNWLFRRSGAFFMRRSFSGDPLYSAVFSEYMKRLIRDNSAVEFFIEGTRSRSGKMLHPKFGLLNIVTETYFDKEVADLQIVPITINYERVIEGETFPFELLGEEKVKESLGRVIKAAKILKLQFGRIYVEFANPISVKDFTSQYINKQMQQLPAITDSTVVDQSVTASPAQATADLVCKPLDPFSNVSDRKTVVEALGYEIVYKLHEGLLYLPTQMVATMLLMHRRGISEDLLIKRVEWLRDQIALRGGRLGIMNGGSAQMAVKNAIGHLANIVDRRKDIFEPSVTPRIDYKNVLMLSYYRNQIMHLFVNEALVACALHAFGHQLAWTEGVNVNRLWEEVNFLANLLKREFIYGGFHDDRQGFDKTVDLMVARGTLSHDVKQDVIKVAPTGEQAFSFLCALLWPFIDAYWVSPLYLFSYESDRRLTDVKLVQQIQWFADSLHDERILLHYESCSQETIKNALVTLESMGVVKRSPLPLPNRSGFEKKEYLVELLPLYQNEQNLQQLVDHISQFRKVSFLKYVNPTTAMRKSMIADFPMMAKL
eukprot:GILJ01011431.1.p1 GENE.GILJ01011431.1~~GILJ01011431.1.p1  ORF type:complete len:1177 (+),score=214.25 GILJ01011431.1:40-3570(+)